MFKYFIVNLFFFNFVYVFLILEKKFSQIQNVVGIYINIVIIYIFVNKVSSIIIINKLLKILIYIHIYFFGCKLS